jgi:hypothetical protein
MTPKRKNIIKKLGILALIGIGAAFLVGPSDKEKKFNRQIKWQ